MPMPDLRLRPYHETRGAVFRAEAGWDVPSSYGSLDSEVGVVRRGAGAIDLSDRAKVRVTGADRVSFLDGLLTCDVKVLKSGASAYALVLDEMSRVLGDLRIYALAEQSILDLDPAQKDALLGYFGRSVVSDDVVLSDLNSCGHVEVHGPRAAGVVSDVLGVDVSGLPVDGFTDFALDRHRRGYAARVRTTGEEGVAIWAADADLEPVWAALDELRVPPIGRDAFDVLRIEAGVPRFGVDMTEGTLALEVAPEGAISFTKGCYKGQEVVARGTYVGHMNRRLLGLRIDGDVPPSRGDPIRKEGQEVGTVTSGTWSPTKGWVIALALLRVDRVTNRDVLFVDHDGWDLRARLHALPFV